MATPLSKNFTLEELCASATAKARGIDNRAPESVMRNIVLLVNNILQPLREEKGVIVIASGYRSPELNKAVGGVKNSQHMSGQACDIFIHGDINYGWDLFEYIETHLPFDQLIMEHNAKGTHWVHVSYKEEGNRHQIIRNLKKK